MARFRDTLPGTVGVPLALLILGASAAASYVGVNRLLIFTGDLIACAFLFIAFRAMRAEVAERKETELQLRRTADEMEDLYNNAPCGYHSVDGDGVIIRINDTELGWLGYRRDEVVAKMKLSDILTAASQEAFKHNFPLFKSGGGLKDIELELVRKDGSVLAVWLSATAVLDRDGNYLRSRSTLFDITQRREAERNLRQANAFLDTILEHIPDMIFVKEADDLRFVRFNRAGADLIGHAKEELIGKNDYDFFPAEEAAFFTAKDREVLAGGELLDIPEEIMHTGKRGVRVLRTKKIPILDDSGNPRYLLGISEDVTERKDAERRILELNRELQTRAQQLEAANKELEGFSYTVSHDLRAPLRAIDGFSRLLEEDYGDRLDVEGRRLLKVVRDNGRRMAHLVEALLVFSRLGRQPIKPVAVNMTSLVQEVFGEIGLVGGQQAAQFVLGNLPNASGDPTLLRQVWANLLSNAVKYSGPRERPRVAVEGWIDGDESVYRIDDNGVGFDMQYYEKLFGVFHRLHAAEEFPGTGVGLAIVQRVVTRHGGRVWAEGRLNDGATFYFSLPTGESIE